MAQSYQTDEGELVIPGGYSSVKVKSSPSGLSTNGVLMLVGEADGGPDWSLETDLKTGFGTDQIADVRAKYISGPLVDGYAAAIAPAADEQINGAPSKIILIKTNPSTKASSVLTKIGGGTYATLYDKGYGDLGNLIYYTLASNTAEVLPTTGAFTFLPPIAATDVEYRVNGGAARSQTISALMTPAAFAAAANALTDVAATGGTDRAVFTGTHGGAATVAMAVNVGGVANAVVITLAGIASWDNIPSVGDTLFLSSTSVLADGETQNRGSYVVTGASATTISATKLLDNSGTPAQLTSPIAVVAVTVIATGDVLCYQPVTITCEAGAVLPGVAKTLEIFEKTSNTGVLSTLCYQLNTTPCTFVSKAAAGVATLGTQYAIELDVNRQFDNIQEAYIVGGEVALKVGYSGTTATMTITSTTLTTTVVGGSGANLSLTLSKFKTVADIAVYINAQTGYYAAVGNNQLGNLPPSALDQVTAMGIACAGTAGAAYIEYNGRIKTDAYRFYQGLNTNSALVQLNNPASKPTAGIPDVVVGTKFLGGGAKGATTDAAYIAAVDALEGVRGNFLVPLFSADATTDIADGLTESTSSYTIDSINAYARTHVIKMSTLKKRRNRQAFVSKHSTFAVDKESSANLNHYRVAMTFQDVKNVSASGLGIVQFRPWMGAVLAAGTQAAGFYRGILNKGINCNGVIQAAQDYKDTLDTHEEQALKAGLLPMKALDSEDGGGIIFVSDQTTYGKDNNFVYNSIQATYIADVIAMTSAVRMERMFAGQSVADVSAALALSAFEGIMTDMKTLKLIAASDDAELGFRNLKIKLLGRALVVTCEIKLATLIYFVPISFLVTEVQQSASA